MKSKYIPQHLQFQLSVAATFHTECTLQQSVRCCKSRLSCCQLKFRNTIPALAQLHPFKISEQEQHKMLGISVTPHSLGHTGTHAHTHKHPQSLSLAVRLPINKSMSVSNQDDTSPLCFKEILHVCEDDVPTGNLQYSVISWLMIHFYSL